MRKSVTVKVGQFFPSKLSRITRCPWQKWGVSYFSTTQRKRFCWSHLHQIKREQLSRKGLIFQALKVTNAVNRDDGKVSAGAINIDQYRVMLKCASSKNGTILALSYMHESDDIRVMKSSFLSYYWNIPLCQNFPTTSLAILNCQTLSVQNCVSCLESSFIYWTIFQPVLLPIEQSLWSGFWSRCVAKNYCIVVIFFGEQEKAVVTLCKCTMEMSRKRKWSALLKGDICRLLNSS